MILLIIFITSITLNMMTKVYVSDVANNIFDIYYLLTMCLCIDFYDLSTWCGCWFVVYIRRFIYKFLNVCPFDYTAVAGSGKVGP